MKKLFIWVCCSLITATIFTGCKKEIEEITKVEYIAPSWRGSMDSAPSNPEIGWAYYNTKIKQSFIFDGNNWQIMAQDGKDGSNGTNGIDGINGTGIIWQGELSEAPSIPQTNWAYFNTVDGNSYIYNGAKWDYLAKSGKQDNTQGIFIWLGSSNSAPINPSDGWAYYNTSDNASYIYSSGEWQVIARDGASILWKGVSTVAIDNPEKNWAYYNTTDNKSYIWDGYEWNILAESLGGDNIITVPIKWLGSLTSVPSNSLIGDAYYNSTIGASYIYDGSIWQQISKDGIDGTNSQNTGTGYLITWKGSAASAPTNPSAGWAYYNSTSRKSFIYDGTEWQIMSQDGKDGQNNTGGNGGGSGSSEATNEGNLYYMGETTEVIDGVTYTVKSYAEVYGNPYFYSYYKYFYLDNVLRIEKTFSHTLGCDLDYPYTEFVEHNCGPTYTGSTYYTYYESGQVESYILCIGGRAYLSNYYYKNRSVRLTVYYDHTTWVLKYFYSLYPSGYYQYYYSDGYLYTYEDQKTTELSTSSDVYSSKEAYTEEQAVELLNTLR